MITTTRVVQTMQPCRQCDEDHYLRLADGSLHCLNCSGPVTEDNPKTNIRTVYRFEEPRWRRKTQQERPEPKASKKRRYTYTQSEETASSLSSTTSDDWALFHLRPTAPRALLDAAYRELSKIHHPDKGGDIVMMQKLNAAYLRLKTTY